MDVIDILVNSVSYIDILNPILQDFTQHYVKRDCTTCIFVEKTKILISCLITPTADRSV